MDKRFAMNRIISNTFTGYHPCFCKMNKTRSGENSGYMKIGNNVDKADLCP